MAALNVEGRKSLRLISHSEIETLDTCKRKHDLAYAGQLLGHTLRAKTAAPILRDGSAWGAMVAAWHQTGDKLVAEFAMVESLANDANKMIDSDVPRGTVDFEITETFDMLMELFDHYTRLNEIASIDLTKEGRIPGNRPELQLLVAIPSRTGKQDSNRYGIDARIDLIYTDDMDRDWIVEFKLRGSLTPYKLLRRMSQIRRYAWAWRKATGREIAGVIVDERLKSVPKPPRMVNAKKMSDAQKAYKADCKKLEIDPDPDRLKELGDKVPSHAKDQLCEAIEYEANCIKYGVEPDVETLAALEARQWQQRVPIFLTKANLEDTAAELVGAGKDVQDADTGATFPRAKPNAMNCGGCPFDEICDDLGNTEFIDHLFDRRPPKRDAVVKASNQAAA